MHEPVCERLDRLDSDGGADRRRGGCIGTRTEFLPGPDSEIISYMGTLMDSILTETVKGRNGSHDNVTE